MYTHFLDGLIAFSMSNNDINRNTRSFTLNIVSMGCWTDTGRIDYLSNFILFCIYYGVFFATFATLRFFTAGDAISSSVSLFISVFFSFLDTGGSVLNCGFFYDLDYVLD